VFFEFSETRPQLALPPVFIVVSPAMQDLPWMPHFPTHDEVRVFRFYEPDRDDGFVQPFRVGQAKSIL